MVQRVQRATSRLVVAWDRSKMPGVDTEAFCCEMPSDHVADAADRAPSDEDPVSLEELGSHTASRALVREVYSGVYS